MARGDWNFNFDDGDGGPRETYVERVARELYARWRPKRTADMNRASLNRNFDPFADDPMFDPYKPESAAVEVVATCVICGDTPGPLCFECATRVAEEMDVDRVGDDEIAKEVDGVYTGGRRITRRTEARAIEYREAAKKIAAEAKRKRAVVRHRAIVVEQLMVAGDGRGREEAEAEYERRLGLGHYADWVYGGAEARRRATQKGLAST